MSLLDARPDPGKRKAGKPRALQFFLRVLFIFVFVFGIYGSGKLGVEMARNRIPGVSGAEAPTTQPATPLTLGNTGEPVYLASSPESLRGFFNRYASPGERASADLTAFEIRRINGLLEVTTLKAEADAVEVTVTSGAIAGAVYWVHHTQIPDRTAIDPIISPVPTRQTQE